jgi:beta-N-acetylhexosaminidase
MYRVRPSISAAIVILAVLASACSADGSTSTASIPRSLSAGPTVGPPLPSPAGACVGRVFGSMTEPQRVGQLFALGLADDRLGPAESAAIRDDHVGSVWFTQTTEAGATEVGDVAAAVQALATRANTAKVRFYVAANQEGGQIQALRGPGFSTIPTATEQGTLPASALRADAQTWGIELRDAGVNLDFAPVMDVVPTTMVSRNQPIGVLDREFGSTPSVVAAHGVAFIRGMEAAGVQTTAKHFPGLGRVIGNTDTSAGVVDNTTTPDDPFLSPFGAAIRAGVPFVMVALASYPRIDSTHLAAFSPTVMRLLREQEGFDGVIVSDDLGAAAAVASLSPATRAIGFLEAGGDMIVSKDVAPTRAMVSAVLAKAADDATLSTLVDAAVRRILVAKSHAGLLPCGG